MRWIWIGWAEREGPLALAVLGARLSPDTGCTVLAHREDSSP